MDSELKRHTLKLKTPNPLFEQWISKWKDESKRRGLAIHLKFEKALDSLRKYPILLQSGKECMILEHFDAALCIRLDRKLAEHKISNGVSSRNLEDEAPKHPDSVSGAEEKKKKVGKNKSYIPKPRSAPHALLVALLKAGQPMSKSELIEVAQPLCDSSLTRPLPASHYTGWSSMGKLVAKGLVFKRSNPPKFTLSAEGKDLAQSISEEVPKDAPPQVDTRSMLAHIKRGKAAKADTEVDHETKLPEAAEEPQLIFLPGSFDIILLVDTAEAPGFLKASTPSDSTSLELSRLGIKFEIRHLKIGDFTWIARHKESGSELVLPYIVERKRVDDLSKSILDGRFHEQKFRLKQCKISNLIYLVELSSGMRTGIPLASIQQAVVNTRVVDKFTVKVTPSHKESMSYLGTVTLLLTSIFETKTLFSSRKGSEPQSILNDSPELITFQSFTEGAGKHEGFLVREMFVKQLVQLHGVSAEKAWSIVNHFGTPFALIQACMKGTENFLADLKYGHLNRKVGPQVSQTLFKFYSSTSFPLNGTTGMA